MNSTRVRNPPECFGGSGDRHLDPGVCGASRVRVVESVAFYTQTLGARSAVGRHEEDPTYAAVLVADG